MDSGRHGRAKRLFERIRDLSEHERAEALDRECESDPELRDLVARKLNEIAPTIEISEQKTVQAVGPTASHSSGAALRAGQRFGGYRLVRLLGTGGFAHVWEAEELAGGRHVALKVLDRTDASAQALERFEREGKLAARLNHPRSVYVFGAFEIEGRPAIAMEIVPAGSLEDRLRQGGALPQKEAVDRTLEILEGLAAAHELGIVHRDVKPSNCFIDQDGRAKIGDFGISRSLELDTTLTATGAFLGTPQYASPEQVRGDEVDARSDLYSLGGTLYALLTGKAPFRAESAGKLLSQILTERPAPLSTHGMHVPRGLERVVMRLLEKEPGERYADCAALRSALVPFSSQGLTIAGIAGRPGAFILDNLLTDGIHALLFVMAGLRLTELWQNPKLVTLAVAYAINVTWFSAFESLWGSTPGKRLLRLRVSGLDGRRAPLNRLLVRSIVFFAGIGSPLTIAVALDSGPLVRGFSGLLGYLIVLLPMGTSNGFAGLHELVSGTRVMRTKSVGRHGRAAGSKAAQLEPVAVDPAAGDLGPYRLQGRIARDGDHELLLAADEALGRPVWIRMQPADDTKQVPWDVNRPGRLRRLQRGREDDRVWEAYEDLGGTSVRRRIATRGSLAWEDVRGLLPTLVEELRVGSEQDDLPDRLSLDHLWIDATGQLRLLDFPVRQSGAGEARDDLPAEDWRTLVHQLLLLCLEGRCVPASELDGRLPRLPLPEHARRLVARVCTPDEDPPTLAWLEEELRGSAARPARVTRRSRAFALTMATAPALPLVLGIAFGMARFDEGDGILIAAASLLHGTCLGVATAMVLGVLPALVLTFVLRAGPWLWAFGIRIQTRDGRPASRLRCLYRGLIAYLPALWTAAFWLTAFVGAWAARVEESTADRFGREIGYSLVHSLRSLDSSNGWVVFAIPGALFIAAAIQALIRPERGFADHIAGTHLVSR